MTELDCAATANSYVEGTAVRQHYCRHTSRANTNMAELVAGYLDCMEEAVRYLVEVERYPECHPAVLGLRQHLADYQRQLLSEALQTCS
ncbi:hypothetical protein J6590_056712 [Homalodisca vitripennis]|nr:hypothetical protein J6590_056712 [Homalodisca vitripennis]